MIVFFFFFNDTATTEIYTLSLHDALPISSPHLPPVAPPILAASPGPQDGGPPSAGARLAGQRPVHPPGGRDSAAFRGAGHRVAAGGAGPPVGRQHEELMQWCETKEFSVAVVIRGLVDRFL